MSDLYGCDTIATIVVTLGCRGWQGRLLSCRRPAIAKVLVVDDDRVVTEMYGLALSRAGHDVLIANDGVEGLRAAAKERPDMIFLDIRMPKMDGVEVLRNLVSVNSTRSIPVVMLSNYDEPGLVTQSLDLGAKHYLVKASTNPADLDGMVSQWVTG